MEELGVDPPAALSPPEPIAAEHDLSRFDSGQPALDQWLKERALRSEGLSARTYVVRTGSTVVGYYCLATGAVARSAAPKRTARNMPDPLPVMLLGRLAVDRAFQSAGLGRGLLRDGMARTLSVASTAGVRALLVHAIDDTAAAFYRRYGFQASPMNPNTLLLPTETIQTALSDTSVGGRR